MRYLRETPQEAAQKAAAIPGMRHFAGSGPKGSTCGHCRHALPAKPEADRHCGKVALTARQSFPATTPCCRYFEEKRNG